MCVVAIARRGEPDLTLVEVRSDANSTRGQDSCAELRDAIDRAIEQVRGKK